MSENQGEHTSCLSSKTHMIWPSKAYSKNKNLVCLLGLRRILTELSIKNIDILL